MEMKSFKELHGFEERKEICARHAETNSGYGLVIVEPYTPKEPRCTTTKYKVPWNAPWGKVVEAVRKSIYGVSNSHATIYLMVNGVIKTPVTPFKAIYDAEKDSDGILYVVYCQEAAFGSLN